mgnify:CR=1 FL=1
MADADRTVEAVARAEYGRLLAFLSSEYGDCLLYTSDAADE